MKVPMLALRLILTLTLSCPAVTGDEFDEATQLYEDLFTGYNKQVRPTIHPEEPLVVELNFQLLNIVDLSEADQTLTINSRMYVDWIDVRLSWNPDDYGGLQEVYVKQKNVWLPDVIVENSVEPHSLPGHDSLQVAIGFYGNVSWKPVSIIKTSCKIDVTYFPFDVQLCDIIFVTAVLSSGLHIVTTENGLEMSQRWTNGKWKAVKGSFGAADQASLKYFFLMSRRRSFYVMNIVIPILLLSVTSTLVFSLPADAGEKMGASITLLLAFAVYLTILSDQMPNTSLQVSILSTYLLLLLGVSSLTMLLSVFSLRLHHIPEKEPVTPRFAAVSTTLRKLLRMKPLRWHSSKQLHGSKETRDDGSLGKNKVIPLEVGPPGCRPTSRGPGSNGVGLISYDDENDDVLTWQDVSATFDHCFAVTFNIFITLCTISTLMALLIGSDMKLTEKTNQLRGNVVGFEEDEYQDIGSNGTF